jgi:hypothetical protein
MNGMGIALWRELVFQFLLTFSLLSTIGLGVWVVGAGWSYFRRPPHGPCLAPVDPPPHGNHSPPGTVTRPLGFYRKGGEARNRLDMAKSRARARGSHI